MNLPLSKCLPLAGLALALASSGCAPVDTADGTENAADDVRAAGASYVRVRPDFRRCASPMCGGWWVSRVNQSSTRCVDGSYARECYVAEIDWAGLGLDGPALDDFRGLAAAGRAVLRARIERKQYGTVGAFGELVVVEGWQAMTEAEPSGSFYRAQGPLRVCARPPCFSYDAVRLNHGAVARLSEVNLRAVPGADERDVAKGYDYLDQDPGILVAGDIRGTRDGGRGITATQFYLRVSPGVADAVYCREDADCTMSVYRADIESRDDCYCRVCASTALNVSTARTRANAFERYCSSVRTPCPLVRCILPPPVACVNHACTAAPR